ncbi:MAG: hypothetical protein HFJ33_07730 [Clostridia bacterium]|nr:hypothetical protein [Clostridia bacterium]
MKKQFKKMISFVAIVLMTLLFFNVTYASDELKWIVPEKSKEMKTWEALSEDKRNHVIEPIYFNPELKESVKKSTYNQINTIAQASLESSYRRTGLTVRDQKQTGTCWAFAFTGTLQGTGEGRQYSPLYLNYVASRIYNKTITRGANFRVSMGTSASGKFPVLESKMPFDSVYNETTNLSSNDYLIPIDQLPAGSLNQTIDARVMDATFFTNINKEVDESGNITYTDDNGEEYIEEEVQAIRNILKDHIKNKGPITAQMYAEVSKSYNGETGAYNYNGPVVAPNHDVALIGWDDNYAVSNFKEGCRPKKPGAYIALNSQGLNAGKDGYLYISYEDVMIETLLNGINKLEEYNNQDEIPYDKLYQYDELGYTFLIGANTSALMASNVFSRENTKVEYLNEVGIFLPITEGVEIYVNPNSDDMGRENLQKVAVETTNITPGYHIIKLANPIQLSGSKFVVAVKYINADGQTAIPLEANWVASGISDVSNVTDTAKSNPKESYVSLNQGLDWADVYNLQVSDQITLKDTNTCIKAYTTISDEPVTVDVTGVTLNKTEATIQVGKTDMLVATVQPTNATNKNVIWTSSNEQVATVENGVITAKAKGNTTITVTTEDGNHTATCQITVEKKEEPPITVNVTEVKLNKTTTSIKVGETETLVASVLPANATNKNVTWTSSNERVATVTGGVVTGIAEGTTTITVRTENGSHTATCQVNIQKTEEKPTITKVTGVTLNQKSLTLTVGNSGNVVATITPANATNKEVQWKVEDETIATISKTGIIKALKEGTTTITVTTLDGDFKATCKLTVAKKTNSPDDIYSDDGSNTNHTNGQNGSNKNNTISGDSTVSNSKMPYAGNSITLFIGIVLAVIVTVVLLIKFRRLKDIK